jgi:hypothetical protein
MDMGEGCYWPVEDKIKILKKIGIDEIEYRRNYYPETLTWTQKYIPNLYRLLNKILK